MIVKSNCCDYYRPQTRSALQLVKLALKKKKNYLNYMHKNLFCNDML